VRHNHCIYVHLANFSPARWYRALGIYFQCGRSHLGGCPQVLSKSLCSGRKYWIPHHCWYPTLDWHMRHPDC
jgi:hypothetical protein